MKSYLGVLSGFMLLSLLVLPSFAAERVKTDGKSKDSPVKVSALNFMDSGYGQPGPNAEIRISTTIMNSSKTDDLKNVVIHLQLKRPDGSVAQEWTKSVPVLKKGTSVEFDPGAVYYNFSFNNLQGAVLVEHDKVEKAKDPADEATPKP